MSTQTISKRETILKVSEEIFATKGFDGARVDEIAKKANVNKALIYYYFKSKEDLLDKIIKNRIDEIIKFSEIAKREALNLKPGETEMYVSEKVIKLIHEHRNFIKVVLSESLKSNSKDQSMFAIADLFFMRVRKGLQNKGDNLKSDDEGRFIYFFFILMPISAFSIFHQKWIEHYKKDAERDNKLFINALKSTVKHLLCEDM